MKTTIDNIEKEKKLAIKKLLKLLKTNSTVYTNVINISKTGLSRTVRFNALYKNDLHSLDSDIVKLLDLKIDKVSGGVILKSHSMDIANSVVIRLSEVLYKNSHTLKQRWA